MRRHIRQRIGVGAASLMLVLTACSGAKAPQDAASDGSGDSELQADVAPGVEGAESAAPGSLAPGATTAPGSAAGAPAGSTGPGKSGGTSAGGSNGSSTGGTTGATTGGSRPGTAPGSSNQANLFAGALNTRGITSKEITICGHAALTYGPAFNATKDDFNVYYSAVNDAGGIFGRKIEATYENDDYKPATAIQAAEACKAKNPFMILGGIGFDQIPGVRNWAEQNKELYIHHIATDRDASSKQYSYTTQPSVEAVGRAFGELTVSKFKTKKVGILYRSSEFWEPGFDAFQSVAKKRGLNVVLSVPVTQNQANYTQALLQLKNAGAEVVWGWENTLALTQMVKQAKAQNYSPQWVAFPFNLTSQTLENDALTPPMIGLASWPGYSKGDYSGTFASYAADMKEFEIQYAKYRPGTDIEGVAGDLLWLNWVEQKRVVEMLRACGPQCTRNGFVGMLANGYRKTVGPTCALDFSGGRNNGSGNLVNEMETYRSPSGKVNWRSTSRCRKTFL
ncbi:MAG TPA: ABC transporter substrate-binding protein [Mycobacteriales bacterium]|nr:ABC transporter substrate-binding protein [Mycobacteriales bacterium]